MVPTFVHYFSLFPLVFSTTEHKALHSSRTKDGEILDETVFTNPKSFDYDFSDDLVHVADKFDIYDELLSQLPKFNLYKHGRDHGTTTVPVVTRQWDTWYTAVIDGNELITFRPMMHNFQSTKKPLKKLSSKKNRILTFEHSIMHSPKIAKEIANEFSTTTFTVMQRTKSASRSILNDSTPKSVKTAPRKTAMLTTSTTLSPKTLIPRKTKQAREVPRPTTTSDFFMTKMRATVSPRTRGIWRRETTITKDTKSTSSTIMRTTSTTTTPIPTPAAFHANKTGRYSQRRLLERQHSETRMDELNNEHCIDCNN